MAAQQWYDFSEKEPSGDGHIVTGNRRPDGTWRITGIHPPGSCRESNTAGEYWAHLPDWIVKGPAQR